MGNRKGARLESLERADAAPVDFDGSRGRRFRSGPRPAGPPRTGRAHRLPSHHRRWAWLFVGLVLGGMMGNLGERLIHWGVTDYLSLRWGDFWLPPGNVADMALFLSIPLAIPVIVFELMGRARRGRTVRPLHPSGGPQTA